MTRSGYLGAHESAHLELDIPFWYTVPMLCAYFAEKEEEL